MTTIAILGAGNMGKSLLGGLIAKGFLPNNLWISDPDSQKLDFLKNSFNVNTSVSNQQAIENADVIILAVKPQIIQKVATEISFASKAKDPLFISIAAGTRIESLQNCLGEKVAIIRCMPNTPALIGSGISALFANKFTTIAQKSLAENILNAVGSVIWLNSEEQMNAVTAVSGCGPAYFFLVMDAIQSAAITLGLSPEIARMLTLQTALGAAQMAVSSANSVAELKKNVASPGGATESALKVLDENNLQGLFLKALSSAKKRSEELASDPK